MLRDYGKTVWLLLFIGAAAGGALWYAKYRRHSQVLWVETTGLVRHRRAMTSLWTERRGRFSLGLKDNLQVSADSRTQLEAKKITPGTYEVARLQDGRLGLVSSTVEAFKWEPQALAVVEIRSLESELLRLRQEFSRRPEIPNLWATADWLPMKGLEQNFTDYLIKLVEPPSGRRLTPGAEIHLLWTPLPYEDANYSVEIAGSMAFQGFAPRVARTNRLSVHLSETGVYFWRVRAKRRGQSVLSNVSSFEVR